jgi:endonuclease/exonuclease/phosphatase family metal-dependent hydrolase
MTAACSGRDVEPGGGYVLSMRSMALLLALAAAAACGGDTRDEPPAGPATFTVMTQNLYLGADLDPALAPGADLLGEVDRIWASVVATDFPSRAKVVADAIQAAGPDLVALQEVSLWRTQVPGDHAPTPNATAIAYDFLDLLERELAARGLAYVAVAVGTNADIELPGASGNDYRLTDRDAILARSGLPVLSASSGLYAHLATVSVTLPGGGTLPYALPRGWVSISFRAGGKTIAFVNTHLEAISSDVAGQQAAELMGLVQPARQPTIVIGDMNLTPGSPGYGAFVAPATRLADAGTEIAGGTALTCCWDPGLTSGAYRTRIDLVFHTADVHGTDFRIVDDQQTTSGGLHASDHAGVVVGFSAM